MIYTGYLTSIKLSDKGYNFWGGGGGESGVEGVKYAYADLHEGS